MAHFVGCSIDISDFEVHEGLHREAYGAFRRMYSEASRDGVSLTIISGLRTFDYQRYIWEKKWKQLEAHKDQNGGRVSIAHTILKYSAMPAASRHHWGTEVDLNSLENSWFATRAGARVYAWLKENAARFGYCQVYSAPDLTTPPRSGYSEERWHWSYIPVSSSLLKNYLANVGDGLIRGFSGDDLVGRLRIRDQYVSGIAQECASIADRGL